MRDRPDRGFAAPSFEYNRRAQRFTRGNLRLRGEGRLSGCTKNLNRDPAQSGPFERAVFITRRFPEPPITGAFQYTRQLLDLTCQFARTCSVLCHTQELSGRAWEGRHPEFAGQVEFETLSRSLPSRIQRLLNRLPHAASTECGPLSVDRLRKLLALEPDLIVLDHIGSSWAFPLVAAFKRRRPGTTVVYCTHNQEYTTRLAVAGSYGPMSWRRWVHRIDAFKIDHADRRAAEFCDLITGISRQDVDHHSRVYGVRRAALLGPVYSGQVVDSRSITCERPRRIALLGSHVWVAKQNNLRRFLEAAYDTLVTEGIEIAVIGYMESAFLQAVSKRWPKVEFTGPVESVQSYLAESRLGVIAEEAGGGFKLKALDYVFNRLPVFALRGTINDMPMMNGKGVAIFDSVEALVGGIVDRIDDVRALDSMQQQAFDECTTFLTGDENRVRLRRALEAGGSETAAALPGESR